MSIVKEPSSQMQGVIPSQHDCSILVSKYTDLLLTEEQQSMLHDKINYYYNEKAKYSKKAVKKCIFCGDPSGSTFLESYNNDTYIRSLKILCNKKPPCGEWNTSFGVVFNLESLIRTQKKYISNLKKSIIINKNDMMFGYKSEKDALELHDILIKQLEALTDTYSTRLYNYLYFSQNDQMKKDIDKIYLHMKEIKQEIAGDIMRSDYISCVNNSLKIKNDMKCLMKFKTLNTLGYEEYLFNDGLSFTENENLEKKKRKKLLAEKSIIDREQKKYEKEEKKISKSESTKKSKKKAIEKELKHLFTSFELIEELLKDDPDYLEQIDKELTKLKKDIKKYGTEDDVNQLDILMQLYEDQLSAKYERDNYEQEKEQKSIQDALNSEDNLELKREIENEMEILE